VGYTKGGHPAWKGMNMSSVDSIDTVQKPAQSAPAGHRWLDIVKRIFVGIVIEAWLPALHG
jgi:hypothetical protein